MLTEPNIDKKTIQFTLENNYNIEIGNLSFIQGGEASWDYKVEAKDRKIYFLKIHKGLSDHEKRFELMYRLYKNCGIRNITHPIKTQNGELVVQLNNYPCALFNFISGSNAAQKPLDEKQRFALGELLGRIHKAKEIIGDFSLREDFEYENIGRFLELLRKVASFFSYSSQFKKETSKLLLQNEEKILEQIKNLEKLNKILLNQNLDFVICHGEPRDWNTVVSEDGQIFLIDWDDCLFAPKEKDLNFIKDDPIKLDGYKSIVGELSLNKEVISYYGLEWNISGIDYGSNSIFYSNSNDIQNQHFLEEFEKDLRELTAREI